MKRLAFKRSFALFLTLALLSLSLACAAADGKTPGPVTRVEKVRGVPTSALHGKLFMTPAFATYHPQVQYFEDLAQAGTKLWYHWTSGMQEAVGDCNPAMPEAYPNWLKSKYDDNQSLRSSSEQPGYCF